MTKQLLSNVSSWCRSESLSRRRSSLSRFAATWLQLGVLLLLAVNGRGDFTNSYSLTPPDPGGYMVSTFYPAGLPFGNWHGQAGGSYIQVDTTFAPTNLVLGAEHFSNPAGGWFWARAAAAGTVTFDYTVAGENAGRFGWYNGGGSRFPSTNLMTITNFVTEPTTASFHVEAGDYFGFTIGVSPPGGIPPSPVARRSVTIRNFSAPEPVVGLPTLSIYDLVLAEPTNGTANAVFPVRLSAAHTQAVTVAYSTTNATATADSDYAASSGTVTFDPGETNKTITVAVLADTAPEGTETFRVVLSDPTNATLARSQATCTINELRITALAFHVDVSFNSVNQSRYRLQSTEDGMGWTTVPGAENVLGTGNSVTITHTNAACNPNRVYRVLLLE